MLNVIAFQPYKSLTFILFAKKYFPESIFDNQYVKSEAGNLRNNNFGLGVGVVPMKLFLSGHFDRIPILQLFCSYLS